MAAGKKTGGRRKGSLNKKTLERIAAEAKAVAASGVQPRTKKVKTGGRQKGGRNKATTEREERLSGAVAEALAGLTTEAIDAMTPRDVMHLVMVLGLKAGDLKTAYMAATDLAPYFHAKYSAVALVAPEELNPSTMTDAELEAAYKRARREAKGSRAIH